MPHSSGGCSSGGSHSGSHGSGSSYRSSSHMHRTRTSSSTHRYVYYAKSKPKYLYSELTKGELIKEKTPLLTIIMTVLAFIYFSAFGIALIFGAFVNPKPLKMNYDTEIIINDNTGVIGNKERLKEILTEFKGKTGITPAIVTLYNSQWENKYACLEDYAYSLYLKIFDDEKHWLLVYSCPMNDTERDGYWYCEGMQGNYTDSILTKNVTTSFNEDLQKQLNNKEISVDQAFSIMFRKLNDSVMDSYVLWSSLFAGIIWVLIVAISGILLIKSDIKKKKILDVMQEIPMADSAEEEAKMELRCEFCGGVYVKGSIKQCPFCGTKLPLIS